MSVAKTSGHSKSPEDQRDHRADKMQRFKTRRAAQMLLTLLLFFDVISESLSVGVKPRAKLESVIA